MVQAPKKKVVAPAANAPAANAPAANVPAKQVPDPVIEKKQSVEKSKKNAEIEEVNKSV